MKLKSIIIAFILAAFFAVNAHATPVLIGGGANYTDSTISSTVTAIGSTTATIELKPGTWTISDDLTIPANITTKIMPGAVLQIATGKTVTINGPFESSLSQAFSCVGTGAVVFGPGALKGGYVYGEWFGTNTTPGTTDMSAALNAAMASVASIKGTLVLQNNYALTSTILVSRNCNIETPSILNVTLTPASGVDAVTINTAGSAFRYSKISGFNVSGGRRGIYIYGGSDALFLQISRIYVSGQTDEGIFVNGVDVQNGLIDTIRVSGGTYGARVIGATSANANTWINCEFTATTVAGMDLDGEHVTYTISGNFLIGCVFQNNYQVGLRLHSVRNLTGIGCWTENNGRDLTGGPWPSIAILGKAAYPSTNILFQNSTLAANGANQGNLAIQVQSSYVAGPIRIENATWSAGAIVDLGTYAYLTKFSLEGDAPTSITGDSAKGKIGYENLFLNGSFQYFNEGAAVAPSGWTLSASNASAARAAGSDSEYGVELTTDATQKGLYQFGAEKFLKANTIYTLSFKQQITAFTATAFLAVLYNGGAATTLISSAATDAAWVDKSITFKTPASLTATCGIAFMQSGAGGVTVKLDEAYLVEGVKNNIAAPNVMDANLKKGTVTLTANAATTTVSDVRVTTGSHITFEPRTANAAAEIGAGGMYVSTKTAATSFVITHANSAQTDRTFGYVIH